MPKISVVIPTYNRSSLLSRAVQSVLAQYYDDFEVIVIDDCSTDDTGSMLECLDDRRIVYIRNDHNLGAQASRNRGIRAANGDWIAFQDSDDEWMPKKLEKQIEALKQRKFDPMTVVHSNCWRHDVAVGNKEIWNLPHAEGEKPYARLLSSSGPMFQGMLTSKEALLKIGLLDELIPSYQEWDTSIRLAKECCFIHISEPLFIYHLHAGETISKNRKRDIIGYQYIVDKFRDDILQHCSADTLNHHLLGNALRSMRWGYYSNASDILGKYVGRSHEVTLLRLMAKNNIHVKYYYRLVGFWTWISRIQEKRGGDD